MKSNTEANDNIEKQENAAEESETVVNKAEAETETKDTEVSDAQEENSGSKDEAGLAEKLEEVKDKLLRKAAEFDNFRKRTAKEKSENFSMGVCEAVEKLLPVLDNLDRAVESAEANETPEALLDGIKMIRKQFTDALADIGVNEIEAVGKEFDPEKHNAVMMEDSDKPSNTVTDEFAKGYIYKKGEIERVVRHSMVKVSA